MADGTAKKPSIPAWQRAKPAAPDSSTSSNIEQQEHDSIEGEILRTEDDEGNEGTAPSVSSQLEQIDSLLKDPEVAAASIERKRAFLESKAVPKEDIERALPRTSISANDFEQFKLQNQPTRPSQPAAQRPSAPPIVTYPEFLVQAHKPPPLITPERVLNATYFAGGLAALIYGANKFLLTPMLDALTESRHDFSAHSQSKIDEFNERLSKIVSRVPSQQPRKEPELDIEDVESIDSDPTELFHRDMGTQTSPVQSRRSSLSDSPAAPKMSTVEAQTDRLRILREHLAYLATDEDDSTGSHAARIESITKMKHYLDTVLYASASINLWSASEDLGTKTKPADDAIEELKKEIRSVKGVLLSARRFPAAMGRGGA